MYAKVALAIAPLLYLARADVNLDRDDVPSACDAICEPIVELTRTCDTDLRGDRDRVEDRLEAQCVCTNDSFDVGQVAALCADCIRQNRRADDDDDDDDDVRDDTQDIDDILYTCGFSSTSYVASAASALVQSITVEATRPTDESQLSTTIDGRSGGGAATDSGSSPTATGSNDDSNDNNDDSNDSTATGTAANADETNAAAGLAPYGVAGAVIGAAMMLA
ncbi:hypothetical protein ACJ41O_014868 [Fusarium nematophilum]